MLGVTLVAALAVTEGCGSKDAHPPALQPHYGGATGSGGKSSGGGGGGLGGGAVNNCVVGSCVGHSHCTGTAAAPKCECDTGYKGTPANSVAVGESLACTVDTSCIQLHQLQPGGCRIQTSGPPAVGLFFAVDYCSGTAVLPKTTANPDGIDLSTAFKVKEGGNDIVANGEAISVVQSRPGVESYVTFAIDVSSSLAAGAGPLVAELEKVVTTLKPADAKTTPVGISILVFARDVIEYLPFTSNFDTVKASLDAMAKDPATVSAMAGNPGTSLHEAVSRGIVHTERIQALRDAVTAAGVLTTGTLVVVTDGIDNSNVDPPTDAIKNTLVNVITVGISGDINDADLTAMGKSGSFLAPKPADWDAAFKEVGQRVHDYPLRSYLLGYCSTATQGPQTVSIHLADGSERQFATCEFDAGKLGDKSCDAGFFKDCKNQECGGLIACGACADDSCCSIDAVSGNGTCYKPSAASDCHNQDILCATTNQICVPTPGTSLYHCADPLSPAGTDTVTTDAGTRFDAGVTGPQKCDADHRCKPGVEVCRKPPSGGDSFCEPVLQYDPNATRPPACGAPPNDPLNAYICSTLNCGLPFGRSGAFQCLPPARVGDWCGDENIASAVCETGATCDTDTKQCKARTVYGCKVDSDAVWGSCNGGATVITAGECYFDWADKFNR